MIRPLLLLAISSTLVLARFSATPVQSCEAYNNMKHTKNRHHVVLDTSRDYTVLKKHKGQYLLLLKNETPAQRWADSSCFSKEKKEYKPAKKKHTKKYEIAKKHTQRKGKQALLVLSWHNTFCQTHRSKQECRQDKSDEKGKLVLHGLWPQPRNNIYCGVPKKVVSKDKFHQWKKLPNIDIEPETLELMDNYMPGYVSRLHKHEWIKHGTCYGTSADRYYHDALSLAKEVDDSRVGKLLKANIGKMLTIGKIREAFDKTFGAGTGKKVDMRCDGKLISELWVHIGGQGDTLSALIAKGTDTKSRCRKGIVDAK